VLAAQIAGRRHLNRPGHMHMKVSAPGHREVTTHLFVKDSPYLDSDAVFGVRDSLIVEFERCPAGTAMDGLPATGLADRAHPPRAQHVAPEQVILAPDCGKYLPREVAQVKLAAMVEAAQQLRREDGLV
jgi:hypothetical protein